MQFTSKNVRSSSDIHNDPITCDKFTSQYKSFGTTSQLFYCPNTEILTIPQIIGTQITIPTYIPFIDKINQLRKNQTVTRRSNRSNDQTFMLDPTTTTVPTSLLSPLIIADNQSLSSTNNNPFQTSTNLNATANPCQTLYQPHTLLNMCLSAFLPPSSPFVNPLIPFSCA